MTRPANARIAGVTFLVYIAAGIATLGLGRSSATGMLSLVTSFCALVLGVTLYAITREQDPDIALLALACRVIEAIPGKDGGAIFFAVGSTLFSWLMLRGRLIPAALAWLGVVGSIGLVAILFLQRGGLLTAGANWFSATTWLIWLPLLVFELTLAYWLIVKGVYVTATK